MTKKILFLLLLGMFAFGLNAQMPNTLTKSDKVFGLSKFWQEANYNFIYLNKVDREAWDDQYKKMIVAVQETENDYEYYRLLQKFCAQLKDGHTNVFFPREIQEKMLTSNFGEYRLFLKNIDGKAIITRVNKSKRKELPIGTEVTKVNGLPTKEYVKEFVTPYISSSTDHILEDWGIGRLFSAPEGTSFDIEFKLPNGKAKVLKLTHSETSEKEVHPPFDDRELLDFRWIDKDIAYVSLNSFGNPKIDTLFVEKLPELYKAKKLIVDLRYNGGGNTSIGFEIFQYLTKDTLVYGSRSRSRLHIPTFKAWGKWAEQKDTINNALGKQAYLSFRDQYYHDFEYQPDTIRLNAERLVIPTVLLFGHNTASSAEDFLIFADNQDHMYKIGEPTFGSTGQPYMFDLPGGGLARICTKQDMYPDGREFIGYGIQPDLEVKKTLSDHLGNKDPVLETAIEYLKRK